MSSDSPAETNKAPPNLAVRRLPIPVEAPALTRCVLFRPKAEHDPITAENDDEFNKRRAARVQLINSFLKHISNSPDFVRFATRFDDRTDTDTPAPDRRQPQETFFRRISRPDASFHADLIVELHTETFAIGFQIHPREHDFYSKPLTQDEAFALAVNRSAKLDERVSAALRLLTEDGGPPADNHVLGVTPFLEVDEVIAPLYEDFWNQFDKELHAAWEAIGYRFTDRAFDVISEFRGVCVNTSPWSELVERSTRRTKPQSSYLPKQLISPQTELESPPAPAAQALDFINRRRTYFSRLLGYSIKNAEIDRAPLGSNGVLCGMLDGLAVYAAAFHSEENQASSGIRLPNFVRYTVIYSGVSSNQLGRLVLRLHRSGISRISALFDHDHLLWCSNAVRRLGLEIGGSSHAEPGVDVPSTEERAERYLKVSKTFREALNRCRGGVRFRISRSRYYWSRLRHTLKDLRIVRIGGWQTYDDFLQRHLFGQLESTDRLGHRIDGLSVRLDQESDALLSESLVALNRNTAQWQQETATYTQQISHANKEIVRLQGTAEIFAILAGCYYAPGILTNALSLNKGDDWYKVIYFASLIICLALSLIMSWKRLPPVVQRPLLPLARMLGKYISSNGSGNNEKPDNETTPTIADKAPASSVSSNS